MALKLKKLPGNQHCADCDKKNPDWASMNIGVLVCLECSGCHRNLGVHISKVRSLTMDKWSDQMLSHFKKQGGNEKVNALYEAKLDKGKKIHDRSPTGERQDFIRSKYEFKTWHLSGSNSDDEGKLYPQLSKPKDPEDDPFGQPFPKKKPKKKRSESGRSTSRANRLLASSEQQPEDMEMFNDFESHFEPTSKQKGLEPIVPMRPGPPITKSKSLNNPNNPLNAAPSPTVRSSMPVRRYEKSNSKKNLFQVAAKQMTEEQRMAVMRMVKEGKLSVQEAIADVLYHDSNAAGPTVNPAAASQHPQRPVSQKNQEPKTKKKPRRKQDSNPSSMQKSNSFSKHFDGFEDAFSAPPALGSTSRVPMASAPAPTITECKQPTPFDAPSKAISTQTTSNPPGVIRVYEFMPGPMGLSTQGQMITRVIPGGQAAAKGIQVGWRLVQVQGQMVTSNPEVIQALKKQMAIGSPFALSFFVPTAASALQVGGGSAQTGGGQPAQTARAPSIEAPEEVHSSEEERSESSSSESDSEEEIGTSVGYVQHQKLLPQSQLGTSSSIQAGQRSAVEVARAGQQVNMQQQHQQHPIGMQRTQTTQQVNAQTAPSRPHVQQQPRQAQPGDWKITPEWKSKLETVTTQTVQAIMQLRKDSISTQSRLTALESKGTSQPAPIPADKLQFFLTRLVRRNDELTSEVKQLKQDNEQFKLAMRKLIQMVSTRPASTTPFSTAGPAAEKNITTVEAEGGVAAQEPPVAIHNAFTPLAPIASNPPPAAAAAAPPTRVATSMTSNPFLAQDFTGLANPEGKTHIATKPPAPVVNIFDAAGVTDSTRTNLAPQNQTQTPIKPQLDLFEASVDSPVADGNVFENLSISLSNSSLPASPL